MPASNEITLNPEKWARWGKEISGGYLAGWRHEQPKSVRQRHLRTAIRWLQTRKGFSKKHAADDIWRRLHQLANVIQKQSPKAAKTARTDRDWIKARYKPFKKNPIRAVPAIGEEGRPSVEQLREIEEEELAATRARFRGLVDDDEEEEREKEARARAKYEREALEKARARFERIEVDEEEEEEETPEEQEYLRKLLAGPELAIDGLTDIQQGLYEKGFLERVPPTAAEQDRSMSWLIASIAEPREQYRERLLGSGFREMREAPAVRAVRKYLKYLGLTQLKIRGRSITKKDYSSFTEQETESLAAAFPGASIRYNTVYIQPTSTTFIPSQHVSAMRKFLAEAFQQEKKKGKFPSWQLRLDALAGEKGTIQLTEMGTDAARILERAEAPEAPVRVGIEIGEDEPLIEKEAGYLMQLSSRLRDTGKKWADDYDFGIQRFTRYRDAKWTLQELMQVRESLKSKGYIRSMDQLWNIGRVQLTETGKAAEKAAKKARRAAPISPGDEEILMQLWKAGGELLRQPLIGTYRLWDQSGFVEELTEHGVRKGKITQKGLNYLHKKGAIPAPELPRKVEVGEEPIVPVIQQQIQAEWEGLEATVQENIRQSLKGLIPEDISRIRTFQERIRGRGKTLDAYIEAWEKEWRQAHPEFTGEAPPSWWGVDVPKITRYKQVGGPGGSVVAVQETPAEEGWEGVRQEAIREAREGERLRIERLIELKYLNTLDVRGTSVIVPSVKGEGVSRYWAVVPPGQAEEAVTPVPVEVGMTMAEEDALLAVYEGRFKKAQDVPGRVRDVLTEGGFIVPSKKFLGITFEGILEAQKIQQGRAAQTEKEAAKLAKEIAEAKARYEAARKFDPVVSAIDQDIAQLLEEREQRKTEFAQRLVALPSAAELAALKALKRTLDDAGSAPTTGWGASPRSAMDHFMETRLIGKGWVDNRTTRKGPRLFFSFSGWDLYRRFQDKDIAQEEAAIEQERDQFLADSTQREQKLRNRRAQHLGEEAVEVAPPPVVAPPPIVTPPTVAAPEPVPPIEEAPPRTSEVVTLDDVSRDLHIGMIMVRPTYRGLVTGVIRRPGLDEIAVMSLVVERDEWGEFPEPVGSYYAETIDVRARVMVEAVPGTRIPAVEAVPELRQPPAPEPTPAELEPAPSEPAVEVPPEPIEEAPPITIPPVPAPVEPAPAPEEPTPPPPLAPGLPIMPITTPATESEARTWWGAFSPGERRVLGAILRGFQRQGFAGAIRKDEVGFPTVRRLRSDSPWRSLESAEIFTIGDAYITPGGDLMQASRHTNALIGRPRRRRRRSNPRQIVIGDWPVGQVELSNKEILALQRLHEGTYTQADPLPEGFDSRVDFNSFIRSLRRKGLADRQRGGVYLITARGTEELQARDIVETPEEVLPIRPLEIDLAPSAERAMRRIAAGQIKKKEQIDAADLQELRSFGYVGKRGRLGLTKAGKTEVARMQAAEQAWEERERRRRPLRKIEINPSASEFFRDNPDSFTLERVEKDWQVEKGKWAKGMGRTIVLHHPIHGRLTWREREDFDEVDDQGRVLWRGRHKGITLEGWKKIEINPAATKPGSVWVAFRPVPGTKVVKASQIIQHRPSPADAEARSEQKFLKTLKGEYPKREPLEVWEITDRKGKYSLRDGNTTFQMLKKHDWKYFPVQITARKKWADIKPPPPHKRKKKNPYRIDPRRETVPISRRDYPGLFGDIDQDDIPNVDDPDPFVPGDTTIEETQLADEVGMIIDARKERFEAKEKVMAALRKIGGKKAEVRGRVKTPFSIVGKLRKKHYKDLWDLAGTMIITPNQRSLRKVASEIRKKFTVLEDDDKYKKPTPSGYRAVHFMVDVKGEPVEIQVKTRRMSELADTGHSLYKKGLQDLAKTKKLYTLVAKADKGDRKAARKIDALLRNKTKLKKRMRK